MFLFFKSYFCFATIVGDMYLGTLLYLSVILSILYSIASFSFGTNVCAFLNNGGTVLFGYWLLRFLFIADSYT